MKKREHKGKRWKTFQNWFVNQGFHCFFLTVILVLAGGNQVQQMQATTISYYQESELEQLKKAHQNRNQSYIPEEAQPYTKKEQEEGVSEQQLELYAKAAALIDADSGRVLYGKDENTRYPMASTTKIMTCIYTIENSNLDDVVTVSAKAASQPKTRLGIREGEQYRMKDLLYALMLESCNDCAVAIAEHVSKSVDNFCREMTVKAQELGCTDTQFETPNGLDSQGHYTTAAELAKIGAYAIKNETFLTITNQASYSFQELTKGQKHTVHNKNAFLTMYEGAMGIKTGYTSKASYCFVGAVNRDCRTFVSVVLASGWYPKKTYKWQDTKKLMDYGVNQYQRVTLLRPSLCLEPIKVNKGIKKEVAITEQGSVRTLLKEGDVVDYRIDYSQTSLTAPVAKNQVVGYLSIYINGSEYKKIPLLTAETCKQWNYSWCLKQTLKRFFSVL